LWDVFVFDLIAEGASQLLGSRWNEKRAVMHRQQAGPRAVGCELSGATATLKLVAESHPRLP